MVKIYKQPFAHMGDAIAIPDASQPDGKMSSADGWTPDYQLPKTDPNYRPVGRQEMNGVFKEVTEALGQVQVQGTASWSADGAPYPINAQVYHNGNQWLALRANSVEPTEGDDWTELNGWKAATVTTHPPLLGGGSFATGNVNVSLGVVPVINGGTGAATANQGRVNLGAAPNPTDSSTIGQWFGFSHAAPTIPAGGTWVVWWIGFDASDAPDSGPNVRFVPGGTSPGTTSKYFGVAWRLA